MNVVDPTALTGARRLLVAAFFGALAALALPPLHVVPLLFVAFPGLLWLLSASRSGPGAFAVGWAFGMGHHLIGLYWVSAALFVDIGRFWWALPLSVAGLPLLLSMFAGLATLLFWWLRPRGLLRPLVFAACWGALEWLRGHAFTGFPWNLAGYAWVETAPVLQTASLVGAYGLSVLTVLVAATPATLLDPALPRRRALAAVASGCLLFAGLAGWGAWRLSGNDGATVPGVRLRLVQPAIEQHLKWAPGQRDQHVLRQLEMTAADHGGPPPTHAIWAEIAVPFFLEEDARRRSIMAAGVPPGGVIVAGLPRTKINENGERIYTNGLAAIDGAGSIVAAYDKFHLVPFGEYVPFRRWMPFGTLDAAGAEYTPGPGPVTLDLPGLPPVSPLICYEVIFPGAVTNAERRPHWLLNITNDAWYGGSAGPYQHFAIARARAVEEGLPLVRVANTGITGVIDGYGEVRARLGLGEQGILDADLPARLAGATLFGRAGDAPFQLFVMFCITIGLVFRRSGRF